MGFDADKVIEEYLEDKSWLVRENANVTKTFTGLFNYVAVEVLKDYALRKVFNFASKHHLNGDIHIHNLLQPFHRILCWVEFGENSKIWFKDG